MPPLNRTAGTHDLRMPDARRGLSDSVWALVPQLCMLDVANRARPPDDFPPPIGHWRWRAGQRRLFIVRRFAHAPSVMPVAPGRRASIRVAVHIVLSLAFEAGRFDRTELVFGGSVIRVQVLS